jgi:WD40 repeat protein
VSTSPDGTLAASAGVDGTVLVTPLAPHVDAGTVRIEAAHDRIPRAIFSPSGAVLAVAAPDGALALFDARSGAPRGHIAVHSGGPMRSLAFVDEQHVLTGGEDGRVALVDLAHGSTRVLARHAAYVRDVAPSPDRTLFASLGFDQSVRVFDAASGALVGLVHVDAPLQAFAWTPDSQALAIVGYEKLVDVVPRALLATLPVNERALGARIATATRAHIGEDGRLMSAASTGAK